MILLVCGPTSLGPIPPPLAGVIVVVKETVLAFILIILVHMSFFAEICTRNDHII